MRSEGLGKTTVHSGVPIPEGWRDNSPVASAPGGNEEAPSPIGTCSTIRSVLLHSGLERLKLATDTRTDTENETLSVILQTSGTTPPLASNANASRFITLLNI